MAAPITTTTTTQTLIWNDPEGLATASIDISDPGTPVLLVYTIANTSAQSMFALPVMTTAQLAFVTGVFDDILAALTPQV
jgi:hypothetical protein